MSRSKKGAFHSLTWRLNNPAKAQSLDETDQFESFAGEITDRSMVCPTCGAQRVTVPVSEVPLDARAVIERSAKIREFVYCPTCQTYSGFSDWSSF